MSEQIFVSYRRDGGDVTAGLICARLKNLNYTVFYDYDSLHGGVFDERIYVAIENCTDFVLVLPPHALDRCENDDDWVRKEIRHALKHKKNIIPVMLPGFDFPEKLPEDIADVARYNGVQFFMAYLDAVIDSIVDRFVSKPEGTVNAGKAEKVVNPLLKRAFIFLEDGDFKSADEYCERVLDQEPENAAAYLGKLMVELQIRKQEQLKDCDQPFDMSSNYQKAIRFGDNSLKAILAGYIEHINVRNETARCEGIYTKAKEIMESTDIDRLFTASQMFEEISEYKDSVELAEQCHEKAKAIRKNELAEFDQKLLTMKEHKYQQAKQMMSSAKTDQEYKLAENRFKSISGYKDSDLLAKDCSERAFAIKNDNIYFLASSKMTSGDFAECRQALGMLRSIAGWKDSSERIAVCEKKLTELRSKDAQDRTARADKAAKARREAERRKKRKKKIIAIASSIIFVIAVFVVLLFTVILPRV